MPVKPNKSSIVKKILRPGKPENDQSSDHPALYVAGIVKRVGRAFYSCNRRDVIPQLVAKK